METPQTCHKRHVPFVRAIAVGILSSILSSTSMALLALLHTRNFQNLGGSPAWKRSLLLCKWRCMDTLLLLLSSCYLILCCFYVALFLAQVTDEDKTTFLTATLTALVKQWFFVPICMSVFVTAFTAVLHQSESSLQWKHIVQEQLGFSEIDTREERTSHEIDDNKCAVSSQCLADYEDEASVCSGEACGKYIPGATLSVDLVKTPKAVNRDATPDKSQVEKRGNAFLPNFCCMCKSDQQGIAGLPPTDLTMIKLVMPPRQQQAGPVIQQSVGLSTPSR